ncbi:EamA family transporter [Ramlibacter sp.]|uniref:EamA family transporter n=1 Tax=Ramlibacter sp. TaxID=1917967 RepID=UPI002D4900AB|nr:EamA family transporter [Ramlibacter sp.]HYD75428.1 EamA family transporter [Ramlibacter sp.]
MSSAGLSWGVAGAVLFGALLHAGWNALVKSGRDKALDMALLQLLGSVLGLPLVALAGWPPAAAWPWLLASVAIHIGYYVALAGAYEHGELGLAYPLMRGSAPVLVAMASALALGETPSLASWAGVLGVCIGVLVLGLSTAGLHSRRAVGFALANAVIIALYTVVDALGVRAATRGGGTAWQYVAALFALDGWLYTALVWRRRGWAAAWPHARARAVLAAGGAAASMGSYGIALWAMTRAPVATVAALRETSVLFAALLGTWLLKEAFTPRRAVGTALVLAGVVSLRLG